MRPMFKIIAAAAIGLLAMTGLANAQSVTILPGGCGTGSFPNNSGYLTIDSTGRLCDQIGGAGSPSIITPVAPSGALTLTTGGASQQLFAANEVVLGCTIQNPLTATEAIFIDFTGAPAVTTSGGTSIQVIAGQTIPCGDGIKPSVHWIAATTGHAINVVKF